MQIKKNYLEIFSFLISFIYGFGVFRYIYNHNEYLDQALKKIMITGAILFSIFLILSFIFLKFICSLKRWEKRYLQLFISCILGFSFYALFTIYANSTSLIIMFTFGLKFIFVAVTPGLFVFSLIYCCLGSLKK